LLGFTFAEPWRGVYGIGVRDGLELQSVAGRPCWLLVDHEAGCA
jgi:hypothetical protein